MQYACPACLLIDIMPTVFSKCYGLCKSCLNTCGQVLHLSPNQSKQKSLSTSSSSPSSSSPLEKTTTINNMSTINDHPNGSADKPTIVIAPGAWQNAKVYDTLRAVLSNMGYPSVCRSPPSTTLPHGDTDLAADAKFVREEMILPLLAEGKEVVLLMHSFGGVYGGASVKGLSKSGRRGKGERGGVVALVYMAAAIVPSGMSTLERMGVGEELLPWVELDKKTGLLTIPDPTPLMFHNLPAADAAFWSARMDHQAIAPMRSTVTYTPAEDPLYRPHMAYLLCTDDQTFHLASQKKFLEGAGITETRELVGKSHMPFLEDAEGTASAVAGLVGRVRM